MVGVAVERLAFLVEWLDPSSGVLWKYQLLQYPDTHEVEMIDIKNRRSFLKRVRLEGITPDMLFLGATLTVFSRQLKVVDYADEYTARQLSSTQERTLAMVKPDAFLNLGAAVEAVNAAGLQIGQLRMCQLAPSDAQRFYAVHSGKPFYEGLVQFMSSGPVLAMELVGPGAIKQWRQLIGPTDSSRARAEAPQSLRAHFGADGTRNAFHGSDAPDTAAQEIGFFFSSSSLGRCAQCAGTTLCLIKPHAIRAGKAGPILSRLQQSFAIAALQMFHVSAVNAAEFYEVYKGVVPPGEFSGMVDEITSGPVIAVEVADAQGGSPVEALRDLAGPADPELARVLRPNSLRAQYGTSKVLNAVHATDLVEDGDLEVAYFFTLLQS